MRWFDNEGSVPRAQETSDLGASWRRLATMNSNWVYPPVLSNPLRWLTRSLNPRFAPLITLEKGYGASAEKGKEVPLAAVTVRGWRGTKGANLPNLPPRLPTGRRSLGDQQKGGERNGPGEKRGRTLRSKRSVQMKKHCR